MSKFFHIFKLLVFVLLWSSCSKPDQTYGPIDFLSWDKIRLDTDQTKYVNVELDGFIQFVGESDYPEVRLWESTEAMKFERPFMSITVNAESICPILLKNGESPIAQWKELNGKYVCIRGIFQDQKHGFDYIDLGDFIETYDLTVNMGGRLEVFHAAR